MAEKNKTEYYLKIKVLPSSSKNEFRDVLEDGTIKIAIAAIPEKGRANKELIKFISIEFGVKKDCVKVISGLDQRVKLLRIMVKRK